MNVIAVDVEWTPGKSTGWSCDDLRLMRAALFQRQRAAQARRCPV